MLTSARYTKVRGELGLKGYARCMDGAGASCLEQAMRFLDGEPANQGLALGMGKVVLRAFSAKYTAAPFFRRAVAGNSSGAACKDGDLKTAMVSALGLPGGYDGAAAARVIAETCWSEQKTTIVEQFDEAVASKGGYVLASTCEILKAKKALTDKQARTCARNKDD